MTKNTRSYLLALLTAMIWGSAFIAQKTGGTLGAFTYNGPRTLLGGLFLIPVIFILGLKEKKENIKTLLVGSLSCGLMLFLASSAQQIGITYTTAGKAGFITSIYAVFVPILSLFTGKKVRPIIFLCALLSAAGLYLINMHGSVMHFGLGDLWCFASSLLFALHIMVIDYFSPKCQSVILSCLQFIISGLLGVLCMFLFESPQPQAMLKAYIPYLYGGIMSTGVAYTLQIVAQKNGNASGISLILCLESVFAAIFGALLLGERMSLTNIIGCALIFTAVILSTLPLERRLKSHESKRVVS